MKVYVVMSYAERGAWVERVYSNMTEARTYADSMANLIFEERNHSNDPEFKIIEGTVPDANVPIPSGEIPNHQCSALLVPGLTNLK